MLFFEIKKDVMKIEIGLNFFEFFPPDKVRQFMDCLREVEEGKQRYGKIELTIAPGPEGKPQITRVFQGKHFEK